MITAFLTGLILGVIIGFIIPNFRRATTPRLYLKEYRKGGEIPDFKLTSSPPPRPNTTTTITKI